MSTITKLFSSYVPPGKMLEGVLDIARIEVFAFCLLLFSPFYYFIIITDLF